MANNKWILCDNELPEQDVSVLAWCPDRDTIYCAYYDDGDWLIYGVAWEVIPYEITAWMPMPEPPTVG